MCGIIVHVYNCCQCNNVIFQIAVQDYTCYHARINKQRGKCPTGIGWSRYNRVLEGESCIFCEIVLGGELEEFVAENCNQESVGWSEDEEDGVLLRLRGRKDRHIELVHQGTGDDDDDEEGGAKLY
ncbi:hypothetical protein F5Y08DRAFT_73419 [Xylaria arbuscula]|nr:hypothetical protein F5Y08DRAFT_73419 [Xylaria arbuscula]